MSALSARRQTALKNTHLAVTTEYPVKASAVIYEGGLVMLDTGGYLVPAADTANCKVVGIADESATGGSSDGDVTCRVLSNVTAKYAASSLVITNLDAPLLYVVDDQTVDETSPANSVKAGIHVPPFISATEAWVFIPAYGVFTYGL